MKKLFTELQIKDLTLRNRIVMPPMCMYCAPETGLSTTWHTVHYATRAMGGAGLIIIEATAIAPEGRLTSKDLGIWEDGQIKGLAEIVDAVHQCGGKIGIQLNHGGRKCEAEGMDIEAPSAIAYEEGKKVPREMTVRDITDTVDEFRAAAERAKKAGFDFIEIHAAHGYLLNEFLSPLTNQRTDAYGGDAERRARILGEVIDAVRSVWSADKPLGVRITAEDYQEGGNHAEDLAQIINLVKDKGVDLIDVSTGGLVPVLPKVFPGYQIPHAEKVKSLTGMPVVGGGLLTEAEEINSILEEGKIDAAYLGRELLRNPYWPLQAAKALGVDWDWPAQYQRAKR